MALLIVSAVRGWLGRGDNGLWVLMASGFLLGLCSRFGLWGLLAEVAGLWAAVGLYCGTAAVALAVFVALARRDGCLTAGGMWLGWNLAGLLGWFAASAFLLLLGTIG